MKKSFSLVFLLHFFSLQSADALELVGAHKKIDNTWDDLEVDTDKVYVVYQNTRKEFYQIKVQEPDKAPYYCTINPDSTYVLSFARDKPDKQVNIWGWKRGEWKKSFPVNLEWPDVFFLTVASSNPLSEKLQNDSKILHQKLVDPVEKRRRLLMESKDWLILGLLRNWVFGS